MAFSVREILGGGLFAVQEKESIEREQRPEWLGVAGVSSVGVGRERKRAETESLTLLENGLQKFFS
jgi:hypothetical protein